VVPSLFEDPMPNVIVEAKQSKLPSVVFRSGGAHELIRHKIDGFICEEKTASHLKKGLEFFLDNENLQISASNEAYNSLIINEIDQYYNKWCQVFSKKCRICTLRCFSQHLLFVQPNICIFSKRRTLGIHARDRYGRLLAVCYAGPFDINEQMVLDGWAMAYRKYSEDYVRAETFARARREGLWRGEFLPPWEWRRQSPNTLR